MIKWTYTKWITYFNIPINASINLYSKQALHNIFGSISLVTTDNVMLINWRYIQRVRNWILTIGLYFVRRVFNKTYFLQVTNIQSGSDAGLKMKKIAFDLHFPSYFSCGIFETDLGLVSYIYIVHKQNKHTIRPNFACK